MRYWLGFITLLLIAQLGLSQDQTTAVLQDLSELSLEELMNVEIISGSKKPEQLSQTAAAVHVISAEDIRRSGVTTLPDVLRLVPGVQVARIDSNKWAVSARGFNDRFANKLLVLVDGRTVYTPLFSGVFWNVQDIMLEDIERIEVIRGPGATLWGANAVNGVINIITKNADQTQGALFANTAGTEQLFKSTFRYGSKVGDDLYYRYYVQHSQHDDFVDRFKNDAADEWDITRGGFRVDWDASPEDHVTWSGAGYSGKDGTTFKLPTITSPYFRNINTKDDLWGIHLLSKWEHTLSDQSDFYLQAYYDRNVRDSSVIGENRQTADLEFQYHYDFANAHDLVWGFGYRFTSDKVDETLTFQLLPPERDNHLFHAFIQDEITLIEDKLRWIIGTKGEHNDYTGFEIQPNTRLIWTPHERHTFWASVSRAVRTPSRLDFDARLDLETLPPFSSFNPLSVPIYTYALGNKIFESEELMAYEFGYRTFITEKISVDAALFYNEYDNLRSGDIAGLNGREENGIPYLYADVLASNNLYGETYGAELSSRIQVNSWWDVQLAFTLLDIQLHVDPGKFDAGLIADERGSPGFQVSALQSFDLTKNTELDIWFRYVDELPGYEVRDIFALDIRLGWQPKENLNVTIGAQNLFDQQNQEFTRAYFINSLPTEIERSYYAKMTITW